MRAWHSPNITISKQETPGVTARGFLREMIVKRDGFRQVYYTPNRNNCNRFESML